MVNRLFTRNRSILLVDLFLIVVAALGSFALRTDLGPQFNFYLPQALVLAAISLLVKPVVFYYFGLYRRMWIYASIQELKLLFFAVTTSSVVVSVVVVLLLAFQLLPYFPRSTLPIDWLLSLALIGGFRFSIRLLSENQAASADSAGSRRVLIIGAGDAGALVLREMQKNADLKLMPVCFLDDDPDKQNQQIHIILYGLHPQRISRAKGNAYIDVKSEPGQIN